MARKQTRLRNLSALVDMKNIFNFQILSVFQRFLSSASGGRVRLMVHETSAGIVIYRQLKTSRQYLLLHYPAGHFDFPKGHVEKGESHRIAAFRELNEETGIKKIIWIEGFRQKIRYKYLRGEKYSTKEVIFFLARTTQKRIAVSFEHKGFVWLSYEKAIEKTTYPQAKNVLKKAEEFLKKL